ncbi:homeobox-leucine zipper protein ROC8-like [Apium graveolens]|uniref:homeobox-leucine zipper protein ROC8-like n=1 Tax=Apium graveolens TaxID=4045 RepID=UPI003D7A35F3
MDDTRDRGGSSDRDGSDSSRRKSHHLRHTPRQIERLEGAFRECPHPDEKMRMELSKELGLSSRQIKFWFQNKRTQLKAKHEKSDNNVLRAENDKIRNENIAIMEALKNVMCPSCRGPDQFGGDTYLKEQKLLEENGQLREQLKRYENIVANYKPLMVDVSRNAMDELIKLVQSDSPFWIRSSADGGEVLNLECYESIFPGVAKSPNVRIESSKDSSVVIIDSLELVDKFMDANKWMEFFPNIVSRATTLEVVSSGLTGSRSGLLQLMYEELQVLSPLVPTRKFYFLRFCEQIEQHTWAIVDVSYNFPQQPFSTSQSPVRLLPSGCLIQDMLKGCSKITWIEHMEIEDIRPIHNLYMKHVCSGLAFGATRKLATLRRTCERLSCLMDVSNTSYFGGVVPCDTSI